MRLQQRAEERISASLKTNGMNWKTNVFILLFGTVLAGCSAPVAEQEHSAILEFKSLNGLLGSDQNTVFIGMRPYGKYQKGHMLRAVSMWRTELERTALPYGGMAIDKASLAKLLGDKGINGENTLVVYDDKGNVDAARRWWLLKLYGFEKVKILDGGLHAWGNPLDTARTQRPAQVLLFTAPEHPEMTIAFDAFEELRTLTNVHVIDNRSPEEFEGMVMKTGAFAAGHVPNALNKCYSNSIDGRDGAQMKLKSVHELREIYGALAAPTDTVLLYCHSGVRSAHTYMVLTEVLGYAHVSNYNGSWIEWSSFSQNPTADTATFNNQPL
jgi:thiosulfate/3-mercaptopyruvate sulfurtransferase